MADRQIQIMAEGRNLVQQLTADSLDELEQQVVVDDELMTGRDLTIVPEMEPDGPSIGQ